MVDGILKLQVESEPQGLKQCFDILYRILYASYVRLFELRDFLLLFRLMKDVGGSGTTMEGARIWEKPGRHLMTCSEI